MALLFYNYIMNSRYESSAPFNLSKPPIDEWATRLREKHGLQVDSTPEELEPVVKSLWANMPDRFEAMELVLGRYVNSDEAMSNKQLGSIFLVEDANDAFGWLVMLKLIEEVNAGPTQ